MRELAVLVLAATGVTARQALTQSAPTTRDSAGVVIVENIPSTREAFRLGKTPICTVPSTDRTSMPNVPDAFETRTGALVVAETNRRAMRMYECSNPSSLTWSVSDSTGTASTPMHIWPWSGDSILALDGSRIWVVDSRGRFTRSLPARGNTTCCFADGSLLVSRALGIPSRPSRADSTAPVRGPTSYVRYAFEAGSSPLDTIGVFLSSEVSPFRGPTVRSADRILTTKMLLSATPFGKLTSVRPAGDRVIMGDGSAYEFRVYSLRGKLERIVRMPRRTVALTPEDIRAYKEEQTAGLDSITAASRRAQLDSFPYPSTMPAYRRIEVDEARRIWVEDYPRVADKDGQWTLFDVDGRLLGKVSVPKEARVLSIGTSRVVLRRSDAKGAAQIEVYSFTPPN